MGYFSLSSRPAARSAEVQPPPASQTPLDFHPLACAHPFPGDAFGSHDAPPRSLPPPRRKLATPAVQNTPCTAPCCTLTLRRRVISVCPSSPDQELLEGPICYLCVFTNKQEAWSHAGGQAVSDDTMQRSHTSRGNLQGG